MSAKEMLTSVRFETDVLRQLQHLADLNGAAVADEIRAAVATRLQQLSEAANDTLNVREWNTFMIQGMKALSPESAKKLRVRLRELSA